MLFIFSTPVLIRHLQQLKTVIFLHWCLIYVYCDYVKIVFNKAFICQRRVSNEEKSLKTLTSGPNVIKLFMDIIKEFS
jgi:hypothetical protein